MKRKPTILLLPNPGIEVELKIINQNICEVKFENKTKRRILLYVPFLGGGTLNEQVFFIQEAESMNNLPYTGNRLERVEGEGRDYLIFTRPILEERFFKMLDIGETLITQTPNILSNYKADNLINEVFIVYSSCMPLVNSDLSLFRDDDGRLTYFGLDSNRVSLKT